MDAAGDHMLAYLHFPAARRPKRHSTNSIERLNGEIKLRGDVVGIFPNEDAVVRLIGAVLLEQHEEWAVKRAHYMTLETIAPLGDDPSIVLPPLAA
jgi:putative transposase